MMRHLVFDYRTDALRSVPRRIMLGDLLVAPV
jgi:alpha-glucosidase (family GH31 glycosyl hydrolase)